jgi:hypothetical protein
MTHWTYTLTTAHSPISALLSLLAFPNTRASSKPQRPSEDSVPDLPESTFHIPHTSQVCVPPIYLAWSG